MRSIMEKILRLFSLTVVVVLIASCHRKPLYDDCICYTTALIPISVDWSNLDEDPLNVTVLLYDNTTGELAQEIIYAHNNNEIQHYAEIAEGSYTAVVFNEQRNQIDYLSCSGYDNLSTLKFSVYENAKAYVKSTTATYVQQPGDLALTIVRDITITEDLVIYTRGDETTSKASETTKATTEMLTNLLPPNKMMDVKFNIHVDNIYFSRTPILVDLENIASSYYADSDINHTDPAYIQFYANDRQYTDAYGFDGYVTGTTKILGVLGDRTSTLDQPSEYPLTLSALFLLIDEDQTPIELEKDITTLINIPEYTTGRTFIELDVYLDESLPEVEGFEGGSGFASSYEGWNGVNVSIGY